MRHVHDNPGAGGDVYSETADLPPKLMVRDACGKYRVAEYEEVLTVAQSLAQQRIMGRVLLNKAQTVKDFLVNKLGGCEREVFAALFLDTRHKLIAYEELFYGTVDGTEVSSREVVKAALRLNATVVILAHNHPSGNPEPSAADHRVTKNLSDALKLVEIRVVDHIVVGAGTSVSFAEHGYL